VLSPDDVWHAILGIFSEYVYQNAEKLRPKIVNFEGKKDLIVTYIEPNEEYNNVWSPKFRWDIFVQAFSEMVGKETKCDIAKVIQSNFSTTSLVELLSSQIALLHSTSKYFQCIARKMGCGISKVHFLGKREDWVLLREKLSKLAQYEIEAEQVLTKWINQLDQILKQFLDTFDGKPDVVF